MRYKRHGTTLLAVLLVAVAGLSMLAMPAAAGTSAQTTTINADNADGSGVTVSDANITFESAANNNPSVGDTLILQLEDSNMDEGDIEIHDATVSDAGGLGSDIQGIEVEAVEDRDAFTGLNDTIVLNVTKAANGGAAGGDTFELDVTFNISQQAAQNDAANFNGAEILDIEADNVGQTGGVLADDTVTNLEIEPGAASELALVSTGDQDIAFDGTGSTSIKAVDALGNDIVPASISEGDLASADKTYSNYIVDANLTSAFVFS